MSIIYSTRWTWLNWDGSPGRNLHKIQSIKLMSPSVKQTYLVHFNHRSSVQSSRGDLFAKGRLKQRAVFKRNLIAVFEGPKDSRVDSDDVKFRKESTRKRCELIRGLSPDAVISWVLAFAPTLWAGDPTPTTRDRGRSGGTQFTPEIGSLYGEESKSV